jgi:glucose/arabinose dehydrogenase
MTACSANGQIQIEPAFPNLSFSRPVDLQQPGDNTDRLFVVEQAGIIRVFSNDRLTVSSKVFLDIADQAQSYADASGGNEQGLLGLAFHPDYEANGYFYVDYTAANPRRTVIARYQVSAANPDSALKSSEFIVLEIPITLPNNSNHNGGQIAFGPDGFLYIGPGDGGSGGDPQGNGQNLQTLLGKILRIDVDNPSAGRNYGIPSDNPFTPPNKEEIYAYGLRNPWRFSFDPPTGRLWLADVGQDRIEEVNIIEKGKNYGWDIMEGSLCFTPMSGCNTSGLTAPIVEYGRSLGRSVTGGYVYRGANVPSLVGLYIYADFETGRLWSLQYDGINPAANTLLQDTNYLISSFGVDRNGELYFCAFDGKIYRFTPSPSPVDPNPPRPVSPQLAQNYPNPFNPSTTIKYVLPVAARVELNIFSVTGQLIRTLENLNGGAGERTVDWDGRDNNGVLQTGGVYLYQLKINGEATQIRRMLFLK